MLKTEPCPTLLELARPVTGKTATEPERPYRPRLAGLLEGPQRLLLAVLDRIYGSAWNPLHRSGGIAALLLVVTAVTGIYLLVFYRVSDPYASVVAIHEQAWAGRWIRALHRYASDGALLFIVLHALKMLFAGRTWGARALAWISGVLLTLTVLFCGWTGLVMIWDLQAQALALESVRLLDLLPIFSMPISRIFAENDLSASFFFMNLFLHVALPLGLALLMLVHVSRVARPAWLPPAEVRRPILLAWILLSILLPLPLLEPADLLSIPGQVPLDLFFGFWVPAAQALPPWQHLLLWLGAVGASLSLVCWWRPSRAPEPSWVDPDLCTGCSQCYHDCPYGAISMVERQDSLELNGRHSEKVALVDPSRCVSCGICAGSCAPMGMGPPDRTGRHQLSRLRRFLDGARPQPDQVVVFACRHSGCSEGLPPGALVYPVECAGSLHSSMIEVALRGGAGGVYVLSCPPGDCLNREGPRWLEARMYHGREAELQERVDRERVRLGHFSAAERGRAHRNVESLRRAMADRHKAGDRPPHRNGAPAGPGRGKRPTGVRFSNQARRVAALAFTAAVLVALGRAASIPMGQTADKAELRLSWQTAATRIQIDLSQRQPDPSVPAHMQAMTETHLLAYRLRVLVDGQQRIDRRVAPPGVHGDRPLVVLEALPLEPGAAAIEVEFAPEPSSDPELAEAVGRAPRFHLLQAIESRPGRVVLVRLKEPGGLEVAQE
ncbi:MAG: hydrogenase iron-sulfur subunit [Armatimonadetes bacterium]|nr:hydrogenase iron-sulfur subunit [Armatimonadota bacterium]